MSSFCDNSIACSPSKSATDKKGAGDRSQVLADLPFNNTAKAQTPREKVKPGKKLDLPANSHSEASQKKQKKNRGTKGAVKEVDKKLDVTIPEEKPSQDKKDATSAKKEEPAHHEFEYFDYRVYLAESDDGFTEVVRKHKPRRSVSSLDKTSSNKESSSSTDNKKRRKKSIDVKKKENSLDKTTQNKGKDLTSTKETPRNSKRSTAPGARSKDQSHTASTKMTNLSTSRPSTKNPKSEKHQLSDKSNGSLSVPSSTASETTVPSISKPLSKGMARSYSSVVAGTNASTTTSRSRTIWNSSVGNTTSKKIASVSGSDLVKNSTQKSSLHSSRGMVKLSKQSQPKKKQPEKTQKMYSIPFEEMATSEDKDESSTQSDLEKKQALVDSSSDERASSEDSDVGCSSLQSYSNSAEKITSLVSSEKITNSSHSFSIESLLGVRDDSTTHSYPEKKQELVGSSSDERVTSEDSDVGCIMSPTDSSQPDEILHVMNANTDVDWHNFVRKTESFFQSLQSQFYGQQSTYPEFEIEQELVSSFSDERATSEDCDAECIGLEAIGSVELSFMPQFRFTSSDRLYNPSLQESLINSPNNNLAVSLPDEMTFPVMNDAWDALVSQTQDFHQTISVDGLQSTHPKLEKNQDERVTSEDSGVLWISQEPMVSSDMSHKPHDNLLMSPNNPLVSSLPDEINCPVINADIAHSTRFFENLINPKDFCRTPGKKRNTSMTDNCAEEIGFDNPFNLPAFESPFPNSDRVRKHLFSQNTLSSRVGQSDRYLNHSSVFESLQLELEDEKDLRQAVEREALSSIEVERTIWLDKLKNVALNNIKTLEELLISAGQKDDRYGYSQLKQKIRDWTLHLEFCDQGLIEAKQGGLQMTTLEKLMDSLQVSSAPISIFREAPVSPVLLERYESVTRAIQSSFPGYPRSSIITKLEVMKALSGGTLNMFSNYHLIKAVTNSINQDRVQQANLASNYLASCRRVYYTAPGPRYSCFMSSRRRCWTASRRGNRKSAGQKDEQGLSQEGGQRTTGRNDERAQSRKVGQSKRARRVRVFFL